MNSRRHFLKQAGLVAAATTTATAPAVGRAADASRQHPDAQPRRIIHLVADGTSSGTLTLGDLYSRQTRGHGLRWIELAGQPHVEHALMNVRSLNSLVTDSAAAASAWGSGSRVMNGSLNVLPDGRKLQPLHPLLGEAGWKRGLVTTTEITHATPAGFAATAQRDEAESIAVQYLEQKIEVLLGGGRKFFDPAQRKDKRDLAADYEAAGYRVMTRAAELADAPLDVPWLGTFSSGHLPYSVDRAADERSRERVPALGTMTRLALRKLGREDRFLLQIEGGRVDHAAHSNDIAAAVHDLVAFDEALEACLQFQEAEPDTLLVVTTDHGTANPGLSSSGGSYGAKPPLFAHVARCQASFDELKRRLGAEPSAGHIQAVIAEATDYRVPDRKAAFYASFFAKKGLALYEAMNSVTLQLGQLLANHWGVGWTSGEHTADYVPLLASGPGARRFRGFLQNTDVFHHYLALARIDFRNPEAPLLTETGPSAAAAEAWERLA